MNDLFSFLKFVSGAKVKFNSGLDSEQENVVGDSDRVSLF